MLWPPHAKSWLIGKDSDAGRDWGQEKGTTEDEMAGWYHGLDGRWVWVNSGRWWWTGRPGMLRFIRLRRVGHDWATELNWTVLKNLIFLLPSSGVAFPLVLFICTSFPGPTTSQIPFSFTSGSMLSLRLDSRLSFPLMVSLPSQWSSPFH